LGAGVQELAHFRGGFPDLADGGEVDAAVDALPVEVLDVL
jgi:hypothetical protein